jgi:hypothetical protein
MSMPTIPEEPHRPNEKEVIIDLLESIALEEIAIAHLLNAESEKIQAFVGKRQDFPTSPSNKDIIKFNKGVNRFLETIVMKEWLLLTKLENVLELVEKEDDKDHRKKKHDKKHGHDHYDESGNESSSGSSRESSSES